jgi:cytochrome c peroxidase
MRIRTLIGAAATLAAVAVGVRAANLTIEQSGQQFSEKSASVGVGDTIVFANHDDVTHNINVINDDDDATDLGLQKPGQNITYKFDKAGRFKVRCSIHPSMKMTVNVK